MATTYTTSIRAETAQAHGSLSTLNRVTAGILIVNPLLLVYAQVGLTGHFSPELTFFATLELVAAGLILGIPVGRWRWTPLSATLLGLIMLAGNWDLVIYELAHPESFHSFTFMVVAVALALLSIGVGLAATMQNYRYPVGERHTPRGLVAALVGVVALCLGAVLVAAIPQTSGTGVNSEVLAQLPALTTPGFQFDQTEIHVRAGETVALRLDNTHGVPHSFDIDELDVHVAMPSGESALALFRPTIPGEYSYYCGIPGHRQAGMVGKLIVEP
jgi:uncharacterized cupredoxin-like copper-binding protein